MKIRPHHSTLLAACAFVALLAGQATANTMDDSAKAAAATEKPFIDLNTTAMNRMMAGMAITPSGKIDRDFVAMMVPHHQGALDMAQAELAYGKNQPLQRIAQQIIVEQLQEIAAMHKAVGTPLTEAESALLSSELPLSVPPATGPLPPPGGSEKPFLAENATAMDAMMAGMSVAPTGNADHDFVAMMVPHHQGAIDMAKAELRYGRDPKLRSIAQEIIVSEVEEIDLMRYALGEPLPTPGAAPTQSTAAARPADSSPSMSAMKMSPGMSMISTK